MGAYADKIAARGTGVTEYAGSLREPKTSGWDAALHGAAQGISLGALPLATAPFEAMAYKAMGGQDSYSDYYKEALRASKAEEDLLQKEHPIAYGAGEVGSYLLPGSGGAQLFKSAGKFVPTGTKLLGKIGSGAAKSALGMAATEGVQGLTDALSTEGVNAGDALKQAAIDAG